jgi:hypothetical protein
MDSARGRDGHARDLSDGARVLPGRCRHGGGRTDAGEGREQRAGDNVTACPAQREYAAGEIMVLSFERLGAEVHDFSLVEGRGGEKQLVDPTSSSTRFWNFLRVHLK